MDPRENSYPRHPRHFFDQRQNFIDPRNPRNLADPFPKYYDNLIMDKRGRFILKKNLWKQDECSLQVN